MFRYRQRRFMLTGKTRKCMGVHSTALILMSCLITIGSVMAGSVRVYAVSPCCLTSGLAKNYKSEYPGVSVEGYGYTYSKDVRVTLDGDEVILRHGDEGAHPVMAEGRLFVPVRALTELLGASVLYDDVNDIVLVTLTDDTTLETYIGANVIVKDGDDIVNISDGMRVFSKDGRAYMPIRTIVEAVGYNVSWVPEKMTIEITSLTD